MDALEMLTRFGHVEPADQPAIDAAATAVLETAEPGHASAHRSRRVARRPRRVLVAAAGVAAAAAFAGAGLSLSTANVNHPGARVAVGTGRVPARVSHVPPSAPSHHAAAPTGKTILTRLASVVRAAPAPAGDATLVIRSQFNGGGAPIVGADLYTDSGQYFYAPTESGLPAQVTADNNQGEGMFAREIAAAEQAAGASNLSSAVHAMEYAPDPTAPDPGSSAITANWLWENSLDALSAGAGNPTVRAGVMRLISTLPEVSVVDTSVNDRPAVQITATFPNAPTCATAACAEKEALSKQPGGSYQEQLTLDAATGIPVSFTGGTAGQASPIRITYQVSRVSVAEVAQGHFVADPAKS